MIKYNLEYWIGKKKIQTLAFNMTKGFCSMKKRESIESGRFKNEKGFKLSLVK